MRRGRAGQHVHALQRGRPLRRAVAQALLRERRNLLRALLRHPAHAVHCVRALTKGAGCVMMKSPPPCTACSALTSFTRQNRSEDLKGVAVTYSGSAQCVHYSH